jgi:tetratricopeptide (TPR) repeat protein
MKRIVIAAAALGLCASAFAQTPAPAAPPPAAAPGAPPGAPGAPPKRYNVYKENQRGQDALNRRDYKTAIRIFTEVLDSGKLADNWIAPTLLFRGKAYRLSKQYDKAIADYLAAVAKDPKFDVAWYELALTYRMKDDNQKAIDAYSKAIELKPTNHLYWYGRCEVRLFINRFKDAETDCERALQIKPDYVPALASLGRVYEDTKRKAKAIETYRRVLQLDPGNKDAKDGLEFLTEKP